jgi:hypothetical protein
MSTITNGKPARLSHKRTGHRVDKSKLRIYAGGHRFGAELFCRCGVHVGDHQRKPRFCKFTRNDARMWGLISRGLVTPSIVELYLKTCAAQIKAEVGKAEPAVERLEFLTECQSYAQAFLDQLEAEAAARRELEEAEAEAEVAEQLENLIKVME